MTLRFRRLPAHPNERGFTFIELFTILVIVLIPALLMAPMLFGGGSCTAEKRASAIRAAENFGFSDVQIVEQTGCAQMRICGEDDAIAYKVSAVNPVDKRVTLTICCGSWSKGCTIRTP